MKSFHSLYSNKLKLRFCQQHKLLWWQFQHPCFAKQQTFDHDVFFEKVNLTMPRKPSLRKANLTLAENYHSRKLDIIEMIFALGMVSVRAYCMGCDIVWHMKCDSIMW